MNEQPQTTIEALKSQYRDITKGADLAREQAEREYNKARWIERGQQLDIAASHLHSCICMLEKARER